MLNMSSTQNIVVLGGNHAGLGVSHYILRHVIPATKKNTGKPYKLTLISPSMHYQYKIGAPRALTSPELIDQSFIPFTNAFAEYGLLFEHVQGEATSVEKLKKTIAVRIEAGVGYSEEVQVAYDSLIIATGVRSASPIWSGHGDYTISRDALLETNKAIGNAETIIIAGGGATGVETAGEVASHWPGKRITLFSGSKGLLTGLKDNNVGKKAQGKLEKLKVKTIHGVKVTGMLESADGRTKLTLSDGQTVDTDVYIDATGGKPNTGFLPPEWLDDRGFVNTDGVTLRVANAPGIFAIGDVATYSKHNIIDILRAVQPLGYSLWSDLVQNVSHIKEPLPAKVYTQDQGDFQVVPVGPGGGVGTAFGLPFPSFMVKMTKSKNFFFDKAADNVVGSLFTKVKVPNMPS